MKTFTYTITDPIGLHARPAGMLVKAVKEYESRITISKDGRSCDASKLMMLMGMGIKNADTVTIEVEGADEEKAAAALEEFFEINL